MPDANDADVVVFDFDLTLTRWETASRFFKGLLRRAPWRLSILLLALPVLGPLLLASHTRRLPTRFGVWLATFGRSRHALEALAASHAEAVFDGDEVLFIDAAVAHLRQHQADGARVVIATGCWEPLARALLARGGLGDVPLVASTLRPAWGGWVSDQHCLGANKIPMLAARGYPPPWAMAYTDHHADLPLLRNSARWYLVSPKAGCLRRIEDALQSPARILDWRV
ncbi:MULTISPECIES: HAD family hydrolase [unclassified Stenotrophomonas]|uniref:HAD family hydrolase n=1 Tax=unclassified Stenotrophomonas TaxID=196198 RepID=UPI002117F25F|nr:MULTISPECIES: HAD family hydrolase [unclassified Stenotrophomonas]